MSNVIQFGKKDKPSSSTLQFSLNLYANDEGQYEVELEMEESVTDFDVYIALLCISAKIEAENEFEVDEGEFTAANDPKGPVQ